MPTLEFTAALGRLAANHLWQSTGFAAVAVLLALALRANHARARYWLWLAASVKFLVPFSVLAAIGAGLRPLFIPATPVSRFPFVFEEVVQPFAPIPDMGLAAVRSAPGPVTVAALPVLLLALWLCGFIAVLLYGWVRWCRVAAAVRSSTPLTEGRELEAWRSTQRRGEMESCPTGIVSSSANLGPGVFGIFRPVLWLPAGIGDRLEDAELEAILAHELCHIRRRDNLFASTHMLVEAIFWFHPLVWWLGARLEEERERACDEEVVRMGGEPQVYAESILKVCEFYQASPAACAAGVTGGELKKRIEGIMTNRFARKLGYGKKLLLAVAALIAVAGPVAIGVANTPRVRAREAVRAAVLSASTGVSGLARTGRAVQPAVAAPRPVPSQGAGRSLVLYFDLQGMPAQDRTRVRDAAQKLLGSLMTPPDKVAIMTNTGEVKVLQDFTDNRRLLLHAALNLTGTDAQAHAGSSTPDSLQQLTALESAVKMLAHLPEKKSLVYFSSGLRGNGPGDAAQLRSTINAALQANVVFYPYDSRGLAVESAIKEPLYAEDVK